MNEEMPQNWKDYDKRLRKAHKWLKEQVDGCVRVPTKRMKELDEEAERRFKL